MRNHSFHQVPSDLFAKFVVRQGNEISIDPADGADDSRRTGSFPRYSIGRVSTIAFTAAYRSEIRWMSPTDNRYQISPSYSLHVSSSLMV